MAGPLPILRVKGMHMVMATAVPRPGRAPMTVPNRTPKANIPRQNGSAMVPNAWKIFSNMDIPACLHYRRARKKGRGMGMPSSFSKESQASSATMTATGTVSLFL